MRKLKATMAPPHFPLPLLTQKPVRNCHQGFDDQPANCKNKKMTLKIKEKSEDINHWPRFVLCWSHKQGEWDQRGVFHMYGNKDQPWLTIRLVKDEYEVFWKGKRTSIY